MVDTADGAGAPAGTARRVHDANRPSKRRCVSNACIACRRRKSKCDGILPACAACASVYHTPCVYDPSSDHRRKGVYKKDIDNLKTQNSTLQTLIEAILNYPEDAVYDLVRQIRSCDSLEELADSVVAEEKRQLQQPTEESPASSGSTWPEDEEGSLESELSGKLGALRLEEGQVRFIGATSNLILVPGAIKVEERPEEDRLDGLMAQNPITAWTRVTDDADLVVTLVNMYFTWHYPYFTTLSKDLFYKAFLKGPFVSSPYCSSLLVNAILALGCHFTAIPGSRTDPLDSATAGDQFFKECKRLMFEHDLHETPELTTVQAMALMSVREAGCGRETKGWVYSGMSFRMAQDLGLHLDPSSLSQDSGGLGHQRIRDEELDARRVTFWGCFLFDKCWSNYMGRMPQLPSSMATVPKYDVFPKEDSDDWLPFTDAGVGLAHAQPSRIRAVSLQITNLCEISNDILLVFYNPNSSPVSGHRLTLPGRGGSAEFKKLSDLFTRLEGWRKSLPVELEAKEGALPSALQMHMFHQTLYIHLFRPFLKNTSPTPLSHLDPRRACLAAATSISKLLRFYKRRYGLKQICNVAGYFVHSACTIHLLSLTDSATASAQASTSPKGAARDIVQGVQALEDMGTCWLVARRSLVIIDRLVRRWGIEVPEEAVKVLVRARDRDAKRFGLVESVDHEGEHMHSEGLRLSPLGTSMAVPVNQSWINPRLQNQQQPLQSLSPTQHQQQLHQHRQPHRHHNHHQHHHQPPQQQQQPIFTFGYPPPPPPTGTTSSPSSSSSPPMPYAAVFGSPQQTSQSPPPSSSLQPGSGPPPPASAASPASSGMSPLAPADSQDWWIRDQGGIDFGGLQMGTLDAAGGGGFWGAAADEAAAAMGGADMWGGYGGL